MVMRAVSYPKVYAEVVSYEILAKKVAKRVCEYCPVLPMASKAFKDAEWRHGKRRYYSVGFCLKVRLDGGEELVLGRDKIGYGGSGSRGKYLAPGVRIKMYSHPRDSRPWRYKFLGE
jgi:hypothetical protein